MSIQFNLSDFTCLVTGGTKGIGKATVELLCKSKAKVYTCSRNKNELDKFTQAMTNKGYQIYGTTCDVSKAKDREILIEKVNENFNSKLDILVNNVGAAVMKPSMEHTDEDLRNIIDTNIGASFKLTQMSHPMLKSSDKGGSIVFVSSFTGGPRTVNASPIYAMSKAAINQLTAQLACEWAKDNIRVNCVAPGFINTPLAKPFMEMKDKYDEMINDTPMKRFGEAIEIANAIVFLSSPISSFSTGSTLIADGGYSHNGVFFDSSF